MIRNQTEHRRRSLIVVYEVLRRQIAGVRDCVVVVVIVILSEFDFPIVSINRSLRSAGVSQFRFFDCISMQSFVSLATGLIHTVVTQGQEARTDGHLKLRTSHSSHSSVVAWSLFDRPK
ncbi:unnamed protein product [Soboliphyme baturini]|uniref:Uncharacterized protein n=1 Tax=Soboliphyme baturini TaxID=241478 RepID=A0A183ITG8_9BILA|nr:unnamed protein product [Soboliphyme baturini]